MLLELLRENADPLIADSFFPLWLVKTSDTIELFLGIFIELFTVFSLRLRDFEFFRQKLINSNEAFSLLTHLE